MVGPVPFPPLPPLTGETKRTSHGWGWKQNPLTSRFYRASRTPATRTAQAGQHPRPPPLGRNTAAFPPTVARAAAAAAGSGLAATGSSQSPISSTDITQAAAMSLEPGRLLMRNAVSDVTQIVPPDRIEVSCPPLATVQSDPRSRPIRARHSEGASPLKPIKEESRAAVQEMAACPWGSLLCSSLGMGSN